MKFKKLSDSESNLITEDDMTVIGDTNPKVTGGFGLSGNWKIWTLRHSSITCVILMCSM